MAQTQANHGQSRANSDSIEAVTVRIDIAVKRAGEKDKRGLLNHFPTLKLIRRGKARNSPIFVYLPELDALLVAEHRNASPPVRRTAAEIEQSYVKSPD